MIEQNCDVGVDENLSVQLYLINAIVGKKDVKHNNNGEEAVLMGKWK